MPSPLRRSLPLITACTAALVLPVCVAATSAAPATTNDVPQVLGATLPAGQPLTPGQVLQAGGYSLQFNAKGNLVERDATGAAVWSSRTGSKTATRGATAEVLGDGSFRVLTASGKTAWLSGSAATGADVHLELRGDGHLVVLADGAVTWTNLLAGSSSLTPYATMRAGDRLVNGTAQLTVTADGHLVDTVAGHQVFQSPGAKGHGSKSGVLVKMQPDGNLVVRASDGSVAWATGSTSVPGAHLDLLPDGRLVVRTDDGRIGWNWGPAIKEVVRSGTVLHAGDAAENRLGFARVVMQTDGNLVLYTVGHPTFATGTAGHPGAYASMQPDGNLVVRDGATNAPLWASGTSGHPGAALQVRRSGELAVGINTTTFKSLGGLGPASAGYYPFWNAPCVDNGRITTTCRTGGFRYPGSYADPFKLPYRICASYVAWWLEAHGGDVSKVSEQYGSDWAIKYKSRANTTPTVGSLAYWPAHSQLQVGRTVLLFEESHIAVVTAVHPGGTVDVSEYNSGSDGAYMVANGLRAPLYIHLL